MWKHSKLHSTFRTVALHRKIVKLEMATESYHEPHPQRAAQDHGWSQSSWREVQGVLVGQIQWMWDWQPQTGEPKCWSHMLSCKGPKMSPMALSTCPRSHHCSGLSVILFIAVPSRGNPLSSGVQRKLCHPQKKDETIKMCPARWEPGKRKKAFGMLCATILLWITAQAVLCRAGGGCMELTPPLASLPSCLTTAMHQIPCAAPTW